MTHKINLNYLIVKIVVDIFIDYFFVDIFICQYLRF